MTKNSSWRKKMPGHSKTAMAVLYLCITFRSHPLRPAKRLTSGKTMLYFGKESFFENCYDKPKKLITFAAKEIVCRFSGRGLRTLKTQMIWKRMTKECCT